MDAFHGCNRGFVIGQGFGQSVAGGHQLGAQIERLRIHGRRRLGRIGVCR